jgi:hypothetical protein
MKVSDIINAYKIWCDKNEEDFRTYWDQLNLQIEILTRNIDRTVFETDVIADGGSVDIEEKLISSKPHWISDQTAELTIKGLIRNGIERMTYRFSSHDAANQIYELAQRLSVIRDDGLSDILDI